MQQMVCLLSLHHWVVFNSHWNAVEIVEDLEN